MRQSLEHLSRQIEWIDSDNLYQAVADLKLALQQIVELLDLALPKEVEPD